MRAHCAFATFSDGRVCFSPEGFVFPTVPESAAAARALELVQALQGTFVDTLEGVATRARDPQPFEPTSWLRDDGLHGGGTRRGTGDTAVFNRASINVSQVHYDDLPQRRLGSATALSCIVHPQHPHGPSMHMHISWTELKSGPGSWRLMADLNPAIPDAAAAERFASAIEQVTGPLFESGTAQGDRYFYVPALERHRGVRHFYLEGHRTDDAAGDLRVARRFGEAVIDVYGEILADAVADRAPATEAERAEQLAYHTVYLFQVCTLDRGTTSGLLVHDQNDVGILGSLPARVDPALLASWTDRVPAVQQGLVASLVDALPREAPATVSTEVKRALARVVRSHYRRHPEALDLQATGGVVPPTVANHR